MTLPMGSVSMRSGCGQHFLHVRGARCFLKWRRGYFGDPNLLVRRRGGTPFEIFKNVSHTRIVRCLRRGGLPGKILEKRGQCQSHRQESKETFHGSLSGGVRFSAAFQIWIPVVEDARPARKRAAASSEA